MGQLVSPDLSSETAGPCCGTRKSTFPTEDTIVVLVNKVARVCM